MNRGRCPQSPHPGFALDPPLPRRGAATMIFFFDPTVQPPTCQRKGDTEDSEFAPHSLRSVGLWSVYDLFLRSNGTGSFVTASRPPPPRVRTVEIGLGD